MKANGRLGCVIGGSLEPIFYCTRTDHSKIICVNLKTTCSRVDKLSRDDANLPPVKLSQSLPDPMKSVKLPDSETKMVWARNVQIGKCAADEK